MSKRSGYAGFLLAYCGVATTRGVLLLMAWLTCLKLPVGAHEKSLRAANALRDDNRASNIITAGYHEFLDEKEGVKESVWNQVISQSSFFVKPNG